MKVSIEDIKLLRQHSGAGISECRQALEQAGNDLEKAKVWLKAAGLSKAASKENRDVKAGLIETYSHGGKVGVLVELLCETDFVSLTEDFKNLAHEITLQIASMKPDSVEELLAQEYVRDTSQTIDQLIKGVVGKLGENILVGRFERIALGE